MVAAVAVAAMMMMMDGIAIQSTWREGGREQTPGKARVHKR